MLELIGNSKLSSLLRQSLWVYPLINSGHIIGLGLLIGSILPLDLRLLGAWRGIPVATLARVLIPVASTGLALAVLCGLLLFATQPQDYALSTLFLVKIALVMSGIANALWLHSTPDWHQVLVCNRVSKQVKLHSVLSLMLWVSVVVCGRLVGYR